VTAALVRTRDQSSVWTASFDSEPTSVLEFQRELANAIAQQVRLHIDPLRLGHQLTPLSTRRALEHFALATPIDPDYPLAWSGIANAYGGMQMTGDAPPRARCRRMRPKHPSAPCGHSQTWPRCRRRSASARILSGSGDGRTLAPGRARIAPCAFSGEPLPPSAA
jgi:hypothetical protein